MQVYRSKHKTLPVKSNFVPKFLFIDISIQQIVAYVGCRPFHPLNKNLPFCHIKVVLQKWSRVMAFPVKFLSNITPKFCKNNTFKL